jgi:hypothetical protein
MNTGNLYIIKKLGIFSYFQLNPGEETTISWTANINDATRFESDESAQAMIDGRNLKAIVKPIRINDDNLKFDSYLNLMRYFAWGNPAYERTNLISVIAASCGWSPLELNEEMTINHQGKDGEVYLIKRIK